MQTHQELLSDVKVEEGEEQMPVTASVAAIFRWLRASSPLTDIKRKLTKF